MASNRSEPQMKSSNSPQSENIVVETTYHSILETSFLEGNKVIVKRCRNQEDERTAFRFRCEVEALMAANDHINVAKILNSDPSLLTITLRLEAGTSLDRYVDPGAKCTLSDGESSMVWKQMASALAYLHKQSIIHDDVKPDNIMWSREAGHSVLIDFGAALIDMPADYFNPSGTPSYAPPEYFRRMKSAKGDIWGLGITMLFSNGCVPLPNGEWILPVALKSGTKARREMSAWLAEVERFRVDLVESKPLLAAMLDPDPELRIGSSELSQLLESTVSDTLEGSL